MWGQQHLLRGPACSRQVSPWPSLAGSGHLGSSGSWQGGSWGSARSPPRSSCSGSSPRTYPNPAAMSSSRFGIHLSGCATFGLRVCVAEAGASGEPCATSTTCNPCRTVSAFQTDSLSPSLLASHVRTMSVLRLRVLVVPLPEGRTSLTSPAAADPLCSGRVPKVCRCSPGLISGLSPLSTWVGRREMHSLWGPAPDLPWRDSGSCLITTM